MSERQSIEPTYDRTATGDRFTVESRLNGRRISFEPIADPFITTTVHVGWIDLLRGLLRRRLSVAVLVSGDRDIVEDVCELDGDYLGAMNSSRRKDWNASLNEALAEVGEGESDG